MNFQQVMAAPGQYIQLQATITDIKHMNGEYGSYALGKAQDNQGQVASVMFTCKKEMQFPTGLAAGHRCNWAGKFDANTQKMKLFFGSMAQADVAAQAPAQAPPQGPITPAAQALPPLPDPLPPYPPVSPGATHAIETRHVPVGRDATGVSIERQATVKAVCERYAGTDADLATMLDACGHFHKWIETGTVDFTVMNTPAPIMTDPNQDDSDLPPELRADYPG